MAAPRTYLVDGAGSGSGGKVTAGDVNGLFGAAFDRLQDNALFWGTVTSGGSEGDDVTLDILSTASGTPEDTRFLERGWLAGMGLRLAWPAANTGAVTVAANGGTALSVVTPEGDAIAAGQLPSGLVIELVYYDGAFVCTSPLPAATAGAQVRYWYILTSSQTWTKPTGLNDGTAWNVGLWGGGGGGSASAGGGGAGFQHGLFRHGDLPSSVSVGIASGGALNTGGGNTTFGSLLTGYGGGSSSSGGAGGGQLTAAVADTPGAMGGGSPGDNAVLPYGGAGGTFATGGSSIWGGGGGASTTGGSSVFGGNGGANGVAGAARGGGGGRNAVGGRGEVWIWN